MPKKFKLLAVALVIAGIFTASFALAQSPPGGNPPEGLTIPNPLGDSCSGIPCVLNTIIKALLVLAAPVVVIMILIGAFQILTAAGNTEKVEMGRKTITYAILGFVLILLASSFIYIIKDLFGVK